MMKPIALACCTVLCLTWPSPAPGQNAPQLKVAESKITSVTVYQNTALVAREVTLPEAAGIAEVVVSPLPASTLTSSVYAEGTDTIRVVSARFRSRAIAEDNREEVRVLEKEFQTLSNSLLEMQAELKTLGENTALLTKLEGFTAATMATLTEKGQLDSEKTIALATHIQDTRSKYSKQEVQLKKSLAETQEKLNFTKRLLAEKSGGVVRTERDAVIVVDKPAGAGTVRLNYLVNNITWKPQYKLRASTKADEPVAVEYQANITQQTGEDWNDVLLTLSTAQPLLNAAPPDLRTLEVAIGGPAAPPPPPGGPAMPGVGGPGVPNGMGQQGGFGGGGGMPTPTGYLKDLEKQSRSLRGQATYNFNQNAVEEGKKLQNEAAAIDQFRDLLLTKEQLTNAEPLSAGMTSDGPSVTYRLKNKLTVPSRSDDQTLQIAKFDIKSKFYYKAVPVLTANVYRVAEMDNTSEMILLPGESTMYLDSDFVGATEMPLVAIGKPFTMGFGVDPQLQVQRTLMDKTRTTQGGNQVLTFKYRILLSSYKPGIASVQVWDRLPFTDTQSVIAVSVQKSDKDLSTDPLYVRDERPKNLLRWDVQIEPKQNGDKSLSIEYEYKMELDKNITIGSFLSK